MIDEWNYKYFERILINYWLIINNVENKIKKQNQVIIGHK